MSQEKKQRLQINTENLRVYDGKEYDEHCSYIYLKPEYDGVAGWVKRTEMVHRDNDGEGAWLINLDYDEDGAVGGIEIVW